MTLFSVLPDYDNYAAVGFNRNEIREKFGRNPKAHIDVSAKPRSYEDKWIPITVTLSKDTSEITGGNMPDVMPFMGKLFLSRKAYTVLAPLLSGDGEFLPVQYELGEGYIFNPLQVAENVEGVDDQLSRKDVYGNIQSLVFVENRVSEFMVFRTVYDGYRSIICQEQVKAVIEHAKLEGVCFTPDLGSPFTVATSHSAKTN